MASHSRKTISRAAALASAERFAAITNILAASEKLLAHHELGPKGLDSVSAEVDEIIIGPGIHPVHQASLQFLRKKPVAVAAEITRVCSGALLLLPASRTRRNDLSRGIASLALLGTHAVASIRRLPGGDGSDHASSQVLVGASIARFATSEAAKDKALWYVAIQGALSYSVAGIAKAFGKPWRDGTALADVMRTRSYGDRRIWQIATKFPRLSKMASWGVILWEALFPLALLPVPAVSRAFTVSAKAFHVFTGLSMKLQRFIWGFGGFHPAIRYVAQPRKSLEAPRDDSLARYAALGVASGFVTLQAASLARRLRVRALAPTWSRVPLSSGNQISYSGQFKRKKRVFVILAGLGVPTEAYTWLASHLQTAAPDCGVLLVSRAGYGSSLENKSPLNPLDQACEDVAELLGRLSQGGQDFVGIGHSIGGEILRRLTWRHPTLLSSVILLDATNPEQFTEEQMDEATREDMLGHIRKDELVTQLGFGALMIPEIPSSELPFGYRRRASLTQRDSRIWSAARRELRALFAANRIKSGPLFPPGTSGLVISAKATFDNPELRRLQERLASDLAPVPNESARQRPIVLDGSHMDIVLRSTGSARVAAIVAQHFGNCTGNK